ncbi:hypothetical protein JOQ06_016570 [Pogonophryne albipinna]|uniref:Uncharacterized protein n=1 Tax=Pogonophryne albipinna TaxID=1090488 RepID=A0AAD6AD79_9TELE|nr:hypothetical protein JOQ06_016570 [Pogonophryne albipinna]
MSSDNTLENLFSVCNSLYKFFRKPTVAAVYTGEKLKRLLDQRWTVHLATVTVIMKSFEHIVHLLREIEDNQTSAAEVRIESTGILKAITQPSFQFIACMMYQILSLLDPPNTALQAKSTDTGVRLVQSALVCVEELRCDSQFDTLWEKFTKDRETIEPLARQLLQEEMSQSDNNWTTQDILRRYCEPLAAMPTALSMWCCTLTAWRHISAMYLHAVNTLPISIIDHTFMEYGHSKMECDSVHAAIETDRKKGPLYSSEGYYTLVRMARRNRP